MNIPPLESIIFLSCGIAVVTLGCWLITNSEIRRFDRLCKRLLIAVQSGDAEKSDRCIFLLRWMGATKKGILLNCRKFSYLSDIHALEKIMEESNL